MLVLRLLVQLDDSELEQAASLLLKWTWHQMDNVLYIFYESAASIGALQFGWVQPPMFAARKIKLNISARGMLQQPLYNHF